MQLTDALNEDLLHAYYTLEPWSICWLVAIAFFI